MLESFVMWNILTNYICLNKSPLVQIATKNGELWSQFEQVTSCPTSNRKWRISVASWIGHPLVQPTTKHGEWIGYPLVQLTTKHGEWIGHPFVQLTTKVLQIQPQVTCLACNRKWKSLVTIWTGRPYVQQVIKYEKLGLHQEKNPIFQLCFQLLFNYHLQWKTSLSIAKCFLQLKIDIVN